VKILLDECVDRRLARHITGHEVVTAQDAGWSGVKNGALLALAASAFDVFVTVDTNLEHQQNLAAYDLAIIVLRARTNRLADLLSLTTALIAAVDVAKPGQALVLRTTGN
jgi:predicted nuclease of predicted toxin-antitoxin system